jgi:hypothetical protein
MNKLQVLAKELCSTPQQSDKYTTCYDNLLWAISVAPESELIESCRLIYLTPLLELPRPLQVVIARLASLITREDKELGLLASLCDPSDESNVVAPIKGRIKE